MSDCCYVCFLRDQWVKAGKGLFSDPTIARPATRPFPGCVTPSLALGHIHATLERPFAGLKESLLCTKGCSVSKVAQTCFDSLSSPSENSPCTKNCQVFCCCCSNWALLEEISGMGAGGRLTSQRRRGGREGLNLPAINQRKFVVVVALRRELRPSFG